MKFKRTHYQFGALERKKRKVNKKASSGKSKNHFAWAYRYREPQPDGTTKHRSIVIGTVEQYPTESLAWAAAEKFRIDANPDNPAQHGVSWGALIDQYLEKELPRRKSTARVYRLLLKNHIRPKWGSYGLADVKPFAVEEWLRAATRRDRPSVPLSAKSKRHLRSLMHKLYSCAMRWELVPLGINPFGNGLVRIEAGEERKRRSLTVPQFRTFLKHRLIREEPVRTAVILAICTGLRCSELFALRWSDVSFRDRMLTVERGIVWGVFDKPKTRYSGQPLPLAAEVVEILRHWKEKTPFKTPDDFIFANPMKWGKVPFSPYDWQTSRLKPAGEDLGFSDSLGWHTFRHTYRTLLDRTRAPMSAQQALMRHSGKDKEMTLHYGEAVLPDKRAANRQVVQFVMRKRKKRILRRAK